MPGFKELYRFADYELRVRPRMVLRHGAVVPLPSKTFEVLLYLVANAGRVVTKDELLKAVWPDSFVEESNLTQHVFRLRKVLQPQTDDSPYIVTVPGQGYQFSAVVESDAPLAIVAPGTLDVPEEIVVQTIRERSTFITEEILHRPAVLMAARRSRLRTVAAVPLFAILLAGLAIWAWRATHRPPGGPAVPIVVSPFENRTGDSSFDLALSSALSIDLGQSPYFAVLSRAEVRNTLALMKRHEDEKLTDSLWREICQRSNSRVLVGGAITNLGSRYLLTLEALDCNTGKTLASARAEPSNKEDVLKSLDRVVPQMRERLGESAASVQRFSVPLMDVETLSFAAVRAYSEAADLYNRGRTDEAMAPLKHALELDPNFALAYADLARLYDNMSEHSLAVQNITKAYALRDSVGERNRFPLLGKYFSIATGDLNEAIRNDQVWAATFPQEPVPWNDLANLQESLGEFPQALESAERAAKLQPTNAAVLTTLARAQVHVGNFGAAAEVCRRAISRGIDSPGLHVMFLRIAFVSRDEPEVTRQLEWSRSGLPERVMLMQSAALALRKGQFGAASAHMARAVEEGKKRGLGGFESLYALNAFLLSQVGLGGQARTLLENKGVATDLSNGLVASALVGDAGPAESALAALVSERPADTLLEYVYAPQVRAAAALRRHDPKQAIQALGPALAYAMRDFHIPSLLGAAYLEAGMPAQAENEYRRIVDHPGIDVLSMQYPLAYLGLARALSNEGRRGESIQQYERFFDEWKSADPDLPVLQKARQEYSALKSAR